jgi:hypothetical protein
MIKLNENDYILIKGSIENIGPNNPFVIRQKIKHHFKNVYKIGLWNDFVPENNLHNYKNIITDQDEIKRLLIGLI